MKFHTMTTSMFLALSMAGCAAGDDGGQAPLPEPEVCEATGEACQGDTICGPESCEPAFDRTYQVAVASLWFSNSKQLLLCDSDPSCSFESNVAVYFSELDDPILADASPASEAAAIQVPRGGYLVVDLGDASCIIDLTVDVLASGRATCAGKVSSIALSIDAL